MSDAMTERDTAKAAGTLVPEGMETTAEDARHFFAGHYQYQTRGWRNRFKNDFDRALAEIGRLRVMRDHHITGLVEKLVKSEAENARLTARCFPSKVVMIDGTGHYVSEAVGAEIARLTAALAEAEKKKRFADETSDIAIRSRIRCEADATAREEEIERLDRIPSPPAEEKP